jgi:purine-nucleoside phosphorylase
MTTAFDALDRARALLAPRLGAPPQIAIVLGSGLGELAKHVQQATVIPYGEIEGMPTGRVEGHAGEFVSGTLEGRRVLVFSGRAHYYEGYSPEQVVFGVRLARLLGAHTLLVTNAAGSTTTDLRPGDLMVIRDHIHLFQGWNPLRGPNDERLGVRFPDMSDLYARKLRRLARDVARTKGVELKTGVYASVPGPSYETPAEVKMLRTLGADAVGMSTTGEAIAAHHMGMEVLGISCITNLAAGLATQALSHDEVKEVAAQAGDKMVRLARGVVAALPGTSERL